VVSVREKVSKKVSGENQGDEEMNHCPSVEKKIDEIKTRG
jgi:hypothetical protein